MCMSNIAVSVIVPVYNVEKYICECLDSAINQTLKNIEIICVDDGSTDGSAAILDEYAKKDSRITVIHKANGGYGQAMNIGNAHAKGEYIGILEPDDYIDVNLYEELYNIAKEKDLDFIKSDFYHFWGDDENRKFEYIPLNGNRDLYNKVLYKDDMKKLFRGAIAHWSGIYKRSAVEKYNIKYNETPGASYQDVGFNFQVLLYMERGYVVDKAYYRYRQDNPNSSIANRAKVFCICDEQKYIYDIIKRDVKIFDEYKPYYNYVVYTTNMYTFNRIKDEFKHEFMQRVKQEYKEMEYRQEIDFSKLTDLEKNDIENIMADYNGFVNRYIEKVSGLYEEVKDYKHIIIYGAGGKGTEVLSLLRGKLDKLFDICFAVTDNTDVKKVKGGYPVRCICDLKEWKDEAIVIIGVNEMYKEEIILKLDELGFANRISIL